MSAVYPTLAAYNADIARAVEAYAADMRVEAGFCESGDGNEIHRQQGRLCFKCRKATS